jgi:plastocyanin
MDQIEKRRIPVKKIWALGALITAFAALAVAGCGGSDSSSDSSTAATTSSTTEQASGSGGGSGGGESIDVSETDFKLNPSDPTVKAGQVSINATNDGQTTHNIEIEGNGIEETELPNDLAPGDSGTLTVDLKPGTYEWYCPVANHRDLGMEGKITVQ